MTGAADASSVVVLIKCTKHVSLYFPRLEAALSIVIVGYFVKTIFFQMELIKTKRLPKAPNHKLSKTPVFKNPRSAVQQ